MNLFFSSDIPELKVVLTGKSAVTEFLSSNASLADIKTVNSNILLLRLSFLLTNWFVVLFFSGESHNNNNNI